MSATTFETNDPLAVKLWSKKLSVEALKETYISRFMGKGSDSIIQIKDELKKDAGDKVTFVLRAQLSGAGIVGDSVLEGNEEALVTHADALVIDQLRNAVRVGGKMTEKRVPFNLREEARLALQDWMADRLDTWFFNHVAGNTAATTADKVGHNDVTAATNIIRAGSATTDEGLADSDTFVLALIDKAIERAKTSANIRPVTIDGKKRYVVVLHPYQITALKTSNEANKVTWYDLQKAALSGGKSNALFDGAHGEYNGVIIHDSDRIPNGVDSVTPTTAVAAVRRAVFLGAQAAVMAFGQSNGADGRMSWEEDTFDYGNQFGVSAGVIGGLKKTVFNSKDFGAIVISTYAVAS